MTTKTEKATLRAELRQELGSDIAKDMAASLRAALESLKTEWIECCHCHKKTPFQIPNMFERAKAAQTVLEQLEGKVGTHRDAPAAARAATASFEDMSDDDLLALLGQEEDDGETDTSAEEEATE